MLHLKTSLMKLTVRIGTGGVMKAFEPTARMERRASRYSILALVVGDKKTMS